MQRKFSELRLTKPAPKNAHKHHVDDTSLARTPPPPPDACRHTGPTIHHGNPLAGANNPEDEGAAMSLPSPAIHSPAFLRIPFEKSLDGRPLSYPLAAGAFQTQLPGRKQCVLLD